MKRRITFVMGLVVAVGGMTLSGCGKSDSGDASKTPAAPTRSVSGQSDLVGTWYTTAPDDKADMLGMEFGKDGKVMLTLSLSQTITTDYSVIDGGRLRLIMPNGQTMVFDCKVDSSSLLLDPETKGVFSKMQFVRLNGQTIAQAHKQKQEEAAKRRQEMLAAIEKQLQQPNLVLVSSDPKLNLSRYALDLKNGGGVWTGMVYSEIANPPLQRQVQVSIQQSEPVRILVDAGRVLGPVGEGDRNPMRITLTAQGTPDKLTLAGEGLMIRSDAGIHDELVKKYEKVAQERQKMIDDFAAQFQAFGRYEGEMTYPNNPNAQPRKMVLGLLRVEGQPGFKVADMTRNDNPAPAVFNQTAVIQWVMGKPVLILPQYQGTLTATGSGGVLSLSGQMQGMSAQFKSTQLLTRAQLAKQQAVVADFLNKQLTAGVRICGTEWVDGKLNMPVPVSMDLKGDAQHNVTGTLKALQMGGDFAVTGQAQATVLGAIIQVKGPRASALKAASNQLGRDRSATMSIQWVDGIPQIAGDVRGGYQTGPAELVVMTPDIQKSVMDKARAALAAGVEMYVTDPNRYVRDKTYLQLKLDPATGKIEGQSSQTRYWGAGAVTGEFKEQDGFPFLVLEQAPFKDAKGYTYPGRHHELWVLFDQQGGMVLSGWTLDGDRNPPMIDALKLFPAKP